MKMNYIYTLVIFTFLYSCSTSNSRKDNTYISNLDKATEGKSLKEIKKDITETLASFKSVLKIYNNPLFKNEIKDIKEEEYEPIFVKDETLVKESLNQFSSGVVFTQSFDEYQNRVNFRFKDDTKKAIKGLPKHIKETKEPFQVYYKEKDVENDSIANYGVYFGIDNSFGKMNFIDSIKVKHTLKYVAAYEEIELSKELPKVKYNGGEIILNNIEKNYVYFTTSDTIKSPIKIQAYNKEGKPLYRKSYSRSGFEESIGKEKMTRFVEFFEKLEKKLDNNKFPSVTDFKEYVKENISALDYFNDEDGYYHRYLYFKGNVDKVKLFFAKERKQKDTIFTAINTTKFSNRIMMPTKDSMLFFNKKLEQILRVKNTEQEQLSETFFEDANYYYHYDFNKKKIDTVLVYYLKAYKNGMVAIQENTIDDDYQLVNSENKKINNKKYNYLNEVGNNLFAYRDTKAFFISGAGTEKYLKNISKIEETNDDDISLVINDDEGTFNEKYGLLNNKGVVITPIIYARIYDFKEGITCVENSKGFYGGINKEGKVVIPFKYNESFYFENGLALVELEYVRKVIDKNGKTILGINSSENVEVRGEGIDRVFLFKNKKYNAKGNLISE